MVFVMYGEKALSVKLQVVLKPATSGLQSSVSIFTKYLI